MGCLKRDSANTIRKRCESRCHERKRDWRKYNELQCREIVLACTAMRGLVDSMTYYSMGFANRFWSRYHRRRLTETWYYKEKVIFGDRLR